MSLEDWEDQETSDEQWLITWDMAIKKAVDASKHARTITETSKVLEVIDRLLYTRTDRDRLIMGRNQY